MTKPVNDTNICYYIPEKELTKEVRKLNGNGWIVVTATMDDPVKRLFFIHAQYIGAAIQESRTQL